VPRSRFSTILPEEEAFLNREAQLGLIRGQIDALRRDPGHFTVLEVLGLGGTGKTRLLSEAWDLALESRSADQLLWVSLEGEASTTETGPLLAIREQLDFECLLFDTALLTYWHATGQPLRLDSNGLAESLPVATLELGSTVAGFILPVRFALRVFEALGKMAAKQRYSSEEFEAIESLRRQPSRLRERLPYYLGLDIRRSIEPADQWLLVFYDAYERQRLSTRESSAPWMKELIATVDRGVHVVSTREPLEWGENEWEEIVHRVVVDALPDRESRMMIRARLGDIEGKTEDKLIEASRRIPFFLEAVVDAYGRDAEGEGSLRVEEMPSSPDSAVAYLLDHLPDEQRELALAVSCVQVFDEELYRHLVKALNLKASLFEFEQFLDWFFVEKVGPGSYKTHDLLTAFVRSTTEESIRRMTLEAATRHVLARCQHEGRRNPERVLLLFRAVLLGWETVDEVPPRSLEFLVDAGFLLYDAGYWNELAALASDVALDSDHQVAVVSELFLALSARRIEGLSAALRRFERLLPRSEVLGRHQRSAELEEANAIALSGDYARVRDKLRFLADAKAPFDVTDRTQLRARIYHAGMLTLDGRFRESSRLLAEAHDAIDAGQAGMSVDWAELVRYRGHSGRFSFALEKAEELYLRAMRSTASGEAPALLGRLQTNLAETYCWYQPHLALGAADASDEINLHLGNATELAKSSAARAVALAKLNRIDAARQAIVDANAWAKEVGYLAGSAFALQAEVVTEWHAGDDGAAEAAGEELANAIARLGTYRHLLTVPFLLLGKDEDFARLASETEWFEPERLEERLASYLLS
jgi:hypothetical protein